MLTFAFTILSLILFAACGYFAYRYGKQELATILKAHLTRSARKEKQHSIVIADLKDRLDQTDALMTQILAQPQNKNVTAQSRGSVWENMEKRAIEERPLIFAVDNVAKVI